MASNMCSGHDYSSCNGGSDEPFYTRERVYKIFDRPSTIGRLRGQRHLEFKWLTLLLFLCRRMFIYHRGCTIQDTSQNADSLLFVSQVVGMV